MLQADEEVGHDRDTLHDRGRRPVFRWSLRQDGVQLNITKQQVENLPAVNTDHPGG